MLEIWREGAGSDSDDSDDDDDDDATEQTKMYSRWKFKLRGIFL